MDSIELRLDTGDRLVSDITEQVREFCAAAATASATCSCRMRRPASR